MYLKNPSNLNVEAHAQEREHFRKWVSFSKFVHLLLGAASAQDGHLVISTKQPSNPVQFFLKTGPRSTTEPVSW